MEILMELLNNPIIAGVTGLTIGLIVTFIVIIKAWFSHRSLVKENASLLRGHVLMHDTGHITLRTELEELKRKNENLRVSVASLKNKTDKSELRTLHIYDKAIRLMNARVPGFAPVWESVLTEAEVEMQQIDTGVVAWVRRTIRPSIINKPQHTPLPSVNQAQLAMPFNSVHNGHNQESKELGQNSPTHPSSGTR
ncbi:MAG: hypothetical protein U1C48_07295 [Methylotenera sp.]|nr:hypothetical protein [Methylotenera sp.]